MSKLDWAFQQITKRFWFRVSIYGIAALVTALVAALASPLVPSGFTERIAEHATRNILGIMASSMLVVATFSMGALISAFAAAAQTATPRATNILIDDPIAQNVLATFLGAFVFSIVGLLAQSFGYYSQAGEVVLLVASGIVVIIVIATLFGWLDHLANMVRLDETIRKIESRGEAAFRRRAARPNLGAMPLVGTEPPGIAVLPRDTGYVRYLNSAALQEVAEATGNGQIFVNRLPGQLVDPKTPLAWASWEIGDAEAEAVRGAFTIGTERSFEQDPRYCVIVLAEIASRALSPGINDPGTAIGVIVRQQRLLTLWSEQGDDSEPPECNRVRVPELKTSDLFEDAFGPLTRDGAGMIEVGVRLQKTLHTLAQFSPQFADSAREISQKALQHSRAQLTLEQDIERLATLSARLTGECAA